jgi:hypothetical protein
MDDIETKPSEAVPQRRLWRVTVERTIMVMAADDREAESEAKYYFCEDDGKPDMISALAVSDVGEIPPKWRNGIPWGGDRNDDRTCRERVEPHDPDRRHAGATISAFTACEKELLP